MRLRLMGEMGTKDKTWRNKGERVKGNKIREKQKGNGKTTSREGERQGYGEGGPAPAASRPDS